MVSQISKKENTLDFNIIVKFYIIIYFSVNVISSTDIHAFCISLSYLVSNYARDKIKRTNIMPITPYFNQLTQDKSKENGKCANKSCKKGAHRHIRPFRCIQLHDPSHWGRFRFILFLFFFKCYFPFSFMFGGSLKIRTQRSSLYYLEIFQCRFASCPIP